VSLPTEYVEKLEEIDELILGVQKKMAAVRGEAEQQGGLDPLVTTVDRKLAVLGHVREDLAEIPKKVAEAKAALQAARGTQQ
jgi:hypothetical protein